MELSNFSSGEISRKLTVIKQILDYVYRVPEVKNLTDLRALQVQYLDEMKSINESYAAKATKLQLNGIHQIMSQWIEEYKIQLDSTRVLIVSAHGPRNDLIEKQYFLDMYAKQGFIDAEHGSSHIICVEMLPEQSAIVSKELLIEFLRKHQINRQVGVNMLGDSTAMDKDVLGQYAPEVLKKLCPYHAKALDDDRARFSFFPKASSSDQPILVVPDMMALKE
jgi:hypothetical protein